MDSPNTDHIPQTEVQQAVVAGHGVELYNLQSDRQANIFSVYDKANHTWRSYYLPPVQKDETGRYLQGSDFRESCAIACTPYIHQDGTIYIGGAGGVLNRLVPVQSSGDGGVESYTHSYAIVTPDNLKDGKLEFVTNRKKAHLLAEQDVQVGNVAVARGTGRRSSDYRSIFHSYETYKYVNSSSHFNMFEEQGLITREEMDAIWRGKKRNVSNAGKYTIRGGLDAFAEKFDAFKALGSGFASQEFDKLFGASKTVNDSVTDITAFFEGMVVKDGPMKEESKIIWERNNLFYRNDDKDAVLQKVSLAADRLMPGLSAEWADRMYKNDEIDLKDERLPVYRVNISEIPENQSQLIISVMGHIFCLDHGQGEMRFVGSAPVEDVYRVDNRGLIVLDENTFVVGDMGHKKDNMGFNTLRVVVDKTAETAEDAPGEGTAEASVEKDEGLTQALLAGLSSVWSSQSPRVKSLAVSRQCQTDGEGPCAALYLRTKHAGADVVRVEVRLNEGELTASGAQKLTLPGHVNNEFMTAFGNSLLFSHETEDYSHWFHVIHTLETEYGINMGQLKNTELGLWDAKVEEPGRMQDRLLKRLPYLPEWVPFTGYGYDGIHAR